MRKIRGFQNQPLQAGMEVQLDERVSHHWLHVLRLQADDEVWLFNGDGLDYPGRLQVHSKRCAAVLLQEPQAVAGNAQPHLKLYQGLCRGERMDWVLQKATELGVDEMQPLQSQHSQLQLHGARLRKRMQHWQQVIVSACEQCGRASVPLLREPLPVSAVAQNGSSSRCLLLHPQADSSLAGALLLAADQGDVQLAVGPEGGFSTAEVLLFGEAGFVAVSLGNNVLRTETAAIAAVALVKLSGRVE